jgi:cytoplasmic iron level regulating protein YaaA (DUF328/UPF0246 family)
MTADISNTLVQTKIKNKSNGEQTIMKIRGQLDNMLINISPEEYQDFVLKKGTQKFLCVKMKKAPNGML